MQHGRNAGIRKVGVGVDQRRDRASLGVFGTDYDRTGSCLPKLFAIGRVGEKTQRLRPGIRKSRYMSDGRSRVADEFAAESSRELPQACLHKYPESDRRVAIRAPGRGNA